MSSKSFKTVTQDLSKGLAQFRAQVPDVQAGFSALHQASMKALLDDPVVAAGYLAL